LKYRFRQRTGLDSSWQTNWKPSKRTSRGFPRSSHALTHETRFGMMRRLIEEEDRTMNFTDFMRDLELNPKTVWESAKKLREGGFVEKIERGKYRCSEVGQRRFILLSLAMRRLIQTLKEMENL